jgi:hypothetical protein
MYIRTKIWTLLFEAINLKILTLWEAMVQPCVWGWTKKSLKFTPTNPLSHLTLHPSTHPPNPALELINNFHPQFIGNLVNNLKL